MKAVKDYTGLVVGILLVIFWMIMISQLAVSYLILGIVLSSGVVFIFSEHLLNKTTRFPLLLKNIGKLFVYIFRLIYAIIIANIQVAKIVLSKNLKLSPTFIRYKSKLQKDATKAILGNSITLTPGTLTVEIENDNFIVHGLTRAHAEGLLDWYMENQLSELEEESQND